MRLVYFDFTNNFGGAPQSMTYLAQCLAREHDVQVIDVYGRCQAYHDTLRASGLACRVLLPEARWLYIGQAGLRRLWAFARQLPDFLRLGMRAGAAIRALDPDVIWVMNEKSLTVLGLNPRLRRYPIVLFVRGWGTPNQVSPWLRWLMRHRVAAVVAVSTATLAQLQRAGIPADKLHLGSSAVDVEKLLRLAEGPLDVELPGRELTPKILVIAARPERAKGHVTAVRALARLKHAGYNPVLWIPGRPGVAADGSFITELRRLVAELGVEANVFFLGWIANMAALIRACDIAILPSRTEGLPRSVLEAMVVRKPVVATPVGGVGDCITEGRTGLLIPVDDDAALADRLQRLIQNPTETEAMVSRAYQHVCDHFDPEQYTRRIGAILSSVAREPRAGK